MVVHGVLFDLGGTLLQTEDPMAWSGLAESVGVVVDADHLVHAARELQAELDVDPGPPPSFEEMWRRILERASGRPVAVEAAHGFAERYLALDPPLPIYSDVRSCLEKLRLAGYRLGVVSNSGHGDTVLRQRLVLVQLDGFFSVLLSSKTEGVRKPDPTIFRRAAERLGLPPAEVVYVGDLPNTDARAATAAGLHGVWLNRYGWGFGEDPPEITSLSELPLYIHDLP